MNNEDLNRVFRRAADSVVNSWPGVVESEDLAQELWIWYLERPSVQNLFNTGDRAEWLRIAVRQGHRIASERRESNARFSTQIQYSPEDIKSALSGESLWSELVDDMAAGLEALRERHRVYVEAIETRYFDRITPETKAGRDRLSNGIKALTEETNRVVRQKFDGHKPEPGKTLGDGPGTKRRVFPQDVNNSKSIFDSEFNGIPGIDMYRSWVEPEMYLDERPARIENWSQYDREDCWSE